MEEKKFFVTYTMSSGRIVTGTMTAPNIEIASHEIKMHMENDEFITHSQCDKKLVEIRSSHIILFELSEIDESGDN